MALDESDHAVLLRIANALSFPCDSAQEPGELAESLQSIRFSLEPGPDGDPHNIASSAEMIADAFTGDGPCGDDRLGRIANALERIAAVLEKVAKS